MMKNICQKALRRRKSCRAAKKLSSLFDPSVRKHIVMSCTVLVGDCAHDERLASSLKGFLTKRPTMS